MDATTAFERLNCCVVIADQLHTDARVLYANPAAQQALCNPLSTPAQADLQGQPQLTSSNSEAVSELTGDSSAHRTSFPARNGLTAGPEAEGPLPAALTGHPLSSILPQRSILDIQQVCFIQQVGFIQQVCLFGVKPKHLTQAS